MVTDRLDMTLAVDWAVKPQHKQTKHFCAYFGARSNTIDIDFILGIKETRIDIFCFA